MPDNGQKGERVFRGLPVSAGVCHGNIIVFGRSHPSIPENKITEEQVPAEVERFEKALVKTRHDIHEIQKKVTKSLGTVDSSIFEAHLLILEDPVLMDEVLRQINEHKANAEQAFQEVSAQFARSLAATEDDYLRERVADIRDVTDRVLNNLMGRSTDVDLKLIQEPSIIIAHDLTPSITAQLDKEKVIGFATETGGVTSHTAIMARSLRIPAAVGLKGILAALRTGEFALLDGYNGVLIINPTDQTLFEYGRLIQKHASIEEKLRDTIFKPAVTLDGHRIILTANVDLPDAAASVRANGGEGVGLFRTEYLFLNRETLPDEDEQLGVYRRVASELKPDPVVIRTLDLGGDKFPEQQMEWKEMNPFLGWRSIRFCLQRPDVFRTQIRAILRASVEENLRLMYPLITSLREVYQANELVEECKEQLRRENKPFNENIEIGAMIETPSAALIADSLARRVKFFSIGTNDLIQYTLAVDRMNEKIAHLFEPTHPAVLRLMKQTIDAAHARNIPVSVCGETAGDPTMVPLLLGMGVDELSASPPLLPSVKFIIRRLKISDARSLAEFALNCESGEEILDRSQALVRKLAPSLFGNDNNH